ncbi:TetR/AcrR family transcriptional regulator [Tenggerimyces flavus]|uniref:TetR/AcrR family transcriptional regulator n=1 Tax=Tenggerimyces flavus TaxID=1708749 RepID=A0ABV7YKL6_9ACTN|nr:TetR family transcriptional regulator [Tenggerimyces flavus]MBM7784775.1 AcrR family transcriptional regulator [Tenggerimyces flavus]
MADDVKARGYRSPLRERQAESTRLAILDAAQRLFTVRGYVRTRLSDVAEEAGVSLATVKLGFKTKPELLLVVWHRTLAGGVDDQVPVAERAWTREIYEAADPRESLRLLARNVTMVRRRIMPLRHVMDAAAAADEEIAELLERMTGEFYANQQAVASHLAAGGHLRAELTVPEATDLLFTLNNGQLYQLLVEQRGWTPERYETWLAGLLQRELLRPVS